ncbi:extracellular catalytic domain type 1 short-chain-length polyhydroxyalkanoate depolymerase [Thalassotalea profundi]|uniref:Esterase n=1 Tax=Thalassotalea profundi TaxID=2036687 RepID=A0ABQ3IXG8_9GAMM|nr:PHB depolymerase family esterase [Thalassotalea profundi]GHE95865.1 hypothetical protein GCM10011501_26810 [Thalassotalea profundi]
MRLLSTTLLLTLFSTLYLHSQYAFADFTNLNDFGENPGELTASYYANSKTSDNVVVLLHGCVQNGETLAKQSGFLGLAKAHNFTILLPQQSENNNIKTCFNWFSPQDTTKDQGESLSLINMVKHVKNKMKANNVYIVGLSAGGAMASAMLVNYPELFKSGAIIAGVPYPCADNLIKAISCMRSGPSQSPEELTKLVKQINSASSHWPTLTIWTGKEDKVVNAHNSIALAQHWAMLSKANENPVTETKELYQISRWNDEKNNTLVELIEIETMGHGMPVNPQKDNGGSEAPFVLKGPVSAALNIIKYWDLQ